MSNIQDTNIIPDLQSPFEQLREVDADGKEWWNSRKLARVMGYGKYWNFERVIAKAQAWTSMICLTASERYVSVNGVIIRKLLIYIANVVLTMIRIQM